MADPKKLELTWIGKENRPRLEPRILLEDPARSYLSKHRMTDHDIFDNRLIFGDNLLALKALESEFAGKVKCVFIDPPYNTGSAFTHYDDGLEHSIWLSLMRDRLESIRRLLSDDGSLWITIDDNECHYLKVLCDEAFGRNNFVSNVVWQKTLTRRNDARALSTAHDHVLVYSKSFDRFFVNKLDSSDKQRATYQNRDNDPRGNWLAVPFHAPNIRPNLTYEIITPSGRSLWPPKGRCWSTTRERFEELVADNRIYFGLDGNGMAQRKKFWNESENKMVPWTWWGYEEAGDNREANREAKEISELAGIESKFDTPKPEKLLKRILEIASNPGDLILDSFAGSGTTGAVAHKMGRRWIMVELGEHCHTHIIPRLKKVIDGEDPGGISKAVDWKGGGGFRYYRLAPSLLEKDTWGNWVINRDYNATMLAEALCKLEGFIYAPSDTLYWQHGYSTESDFIYITTANLNHEQLEQLSDEVGPERSLLVLCTAFRARTDLYSNLTVKKIPRQVLSRCEWGRDDYSLRVENLPSAPVAPGQLELFGEKESR
ncbi:site-specific DNA-methyltransferase [Thiocapsa rosea]|uniref:site-specific DNA-methyltransferase (adenine-specific) n=1 Tax=Thiocapsa rosea TaxID=69360 RepID=A0A495VEW3_9GAMM|nr:site-specific DNA-methyltransferase [Thiocapsa rosea]RKT46368.1 adenine-specific DNA-methyltransferase [Thiocapsa rosea]